MYQADIAIVGAGMVGLALARSLKEADLSVILIDTTPIAKPLSEQPELRVSAINAANKQVLEQLGVWQHLDQQRLSAYTQMQVWDQDSFGQIQFSSEEMGSSELGHIIENQSLVNALHHQVSQQPNVQMLPSTYIAKVLTGQSETMLMLDSDEVGFDRHRARHLAGADQGPQGPGEGAGEGQFFRAGRLRLRRRRQDRGEGGLHGH